MIDEIWTIFGSYRESQCLQSRLPAPMSQFGAAQCLFAVTQAALVNNKASAGLSW